MFFSEDDRQDAKERMELDYDMTPDNTHPDLYNRMLTDTLIKIEWEHIDEEEGNDPYPPQTERFKGL